MSVTITAGNSYSKIEGLTTAPFNRLRKILSYSLDAQAAYFSNRQHNTIRYLIDNKGNFPTGLLARVWRFLDESSIPYTIIPANAQLGPYIDHKGDFSKVTPYPAQLLATKASEMRHRGIISMPTGSGKSLVIALITAQTSKRTLIVVPTLEIKRQLTESLSAIFKDMSNILVENIDSTALQGIKDVNCLIIDEAHHVAAKTYQKLNKNVWGGIYYRYMLTATPWRNNAEEQLLFEGIAGQIIYKLSYNEAVAAGYIVPLEAYYIEIPKQKTEAYTWAQVYKELVTDHAGRNDAIKQLLLSLSMADTSTLCLVKEVSHGENIAEDIFPFVNGQDEESRQLIGMFNKRKVKVLIGTTGIVSEGVDTKPCEFVIICGLGKAKSAFMQACGRALRTYPGKASGKVIIIKDKSHKFCLRHFNEQCKILKEEYGIVPTKLEI